MTRLTLTRETLKDAHKAARGGDYRALDDLYGEHRKRFAEAMAAQIDRDDADRRLRECYVL